MATSGRLNADWKRLPWKRLASIATFGVLIGLGIAIWRAGNEDLPQPQGVQVITNGQAAGRRAQFASWQFTYAKATPLPDQITQEIDGIRDGVYFKNGKPFIHMRAEKVIYNSLSHDFTVSGGVHFDVDDKGKTRRLDAKDAVWNDAGQTLHIPGRVMVGSEGGALLEITNVTINLRNGQYSLGKVRGGVTP